MRNDFAVFILTHGRPDSLHTLKTLSAGNYTGRFYIIIDTEDETAARYIELYGNRVVMFDKVDIAERHDQGDNFDNRKTIFYARNVCFELADMLGLTYFLQFDDDYTSIRHRFDDDGKLGSRNVTDLDRLFNIFIRFLDDTGALSVCFAQGGDFIGGLENPRFNQRILRKAMNSFFCRTDRRFSFIGRINEDVNTYATLGNRGELFFTLCAICLTQEVTQKGKSGMTDVYLESGTYLKSFYSVLYSPSCAKVGTMGERNRRIHHKINWKNCTPQIMSARYKKL
jgi:hypothetical protein